MRKVAQPFIQKGPQVLFRSKRHDSRLHSESISHEFQTLTSKRNKSFEYTKPLFEEHLKEVMARVANLREKCPPSPASDISSR